MQQRLRYRTQQIAQRLEVEFRHRGEIRNRFPDLIILSVGVNDTPRLRSAIGKNYTDFNQFEVEIATLLDQAKQLCPVLFVGMVPVDETKMPFLDCLFYNHAIEPEEYQKIVLATKVIVENTNSDDWLLIWSMIEKNTKFGRNVFEVFANRHSFGINLNVTEKQLADLYIWMIQQYPPSEDPVYEGVHFIGTREQVSDFRNSILTQLKERGTSQACLEIQRIAKQLPELTWMNRVLVESQIIRRRKEWNPPKPSEIFELLSNTENRFVQDGNELLNVLVESLEKLDRELQDQNLSVIDLWNEIPWKKVRNLATSLLKKLQEEQVIDKSANINSLTQVHHNKIKGTTYIPKDENSLSDYVARYLKNNLKNRGIILNREVEIRPLQGGSKGERTDIQVDATIKKTNGEVLDQITVIIEVKGCWNEDLNTSMEEQLVNRYLKDNTCQNGIYLVGWFNCIQWDKSDSNKGKAPKISIYEAREKFEKQAKQLSKLGVKVKSFVLNTALR